MHFVSCCERFFQGVLQMTSTASVATAAPGAAAILAREMLNLSSQALILMPPEPVSHDETWTWEHTVSPVRGSCHEHAAAHPSSCTPVPGHSGWCRQLTCLRGLSDAGRLFWGVHRKSENFQWNCFHCSAARDAASTGEERGEVQCKRCSFSY